MLLQSSEFDLSQSNLPIELVEAGVPVGNGCAKSVQSV
jgi:hypothetical protein